MLYQAYKPFSAKHLRTFVNQLEHRIREDILSEDTSICRDIGGGALEEMIEERIKRLADHIYDAMKYDKWGR